MSEIGYPPHIFLVKWVIHSMPGKYVLMEMRHPPCPSHFTLPA